MMKVIVAGLPKTGTKSMTAALSGLGYNVYDFLENLYYLENEWDKILREEFEGCTFKNMYHNIDAVVDIPACYFWEEIQRQFPDSKVILTVRDNEDMWVKSLVHHFHVLDNHILARIVQIVELALGRRSGIMLSESYKLALGIERTVWGRKTHLNESILKMKYRAHNAHVMQNAPSDKLLVFNCKEGWSPLCKFLGVPVPEGKFPHENIKAQLVDDSAKHPIGIAYQKEVAAACWKFLVKFTFGVGIITCFITMAL